MATLSLDGDAPIDRNFFYDSNETLSSLIAYFYDAQVSVRHRSLLLHGNNSANARQLTLKALQIFSAISSEDIHTFWCRPGQDEHPFRSIERVAQFMGRQWAQTMPAALQLRSSSMLSQGGGR